MQYVVYYASEKRLMAGLRLGEVGLDQAPWQQLQHLLDACFTRPPCNVFERVVAASHCRQRLWLVSDGESVLGMVMLSPHSKGGHLENLAVAPNARGLGIGHQLVQALLESVGQEQPGIVSLTTRIPSFFSPFGFQPCGQLADGSTAMLILLPGSAVTDFPAQ
jgi:ribosomal protein S18 acetylase RimI-like enzyme